MTELTTRVDQLSNRWEEEMKYERQRNDELSRILQRVVDIGLRGGWAEFEDAPIQIPRIQPQVSSNTQHTPVDAPDASSSSATISPDSSSTKS
ncbi:hypothetical protein H0H93_005192 [Arthromyces matolae]|nr:hypothetical protein H0H93_005192 [Arthromyces matolae]